MPRILVTIVITISTLSLTCPARAQSRDGAIADTTRTQASDGAGVQPPAGAQPQNQSSASSNAQPAVAVAARPAAPQSAEEIISRHIEALGGKEKLLGLNSIYYEGKAILPSGLEITARIWRVYDRLYRMELKFGESNIVIIATPGKGWTANPHTGGEFRSIPYEDLKALRVEIDPAGPLADYGAKGFKLEKAGTDTIDGVPCYKIKVSCPSNHSITYSIDENNWYVLKEVRRGGGINCGGGSIGGPWNGSTDNEVTIGYADYKKSPGGYILPYSITVSGIGVPIIVRKVEINKTVDVDALSRPRW